MTDGHHDKCDRDDVHRGEGSEVRARHASKAEAATLSLGRGALGDGDEQGGDDGDDEAGPDEMGPEPPPRAGRLLRVDTETLPRVR
jgi:hypothetical protein